MENPSPFSEWPREKLEEQVIKGLKHIKALRKQNTELLEAAHELETRLANQMQMASELAEENDRLQSKSKTSGFTIGNIGKTITSMITGSHGSLILDSNTSSISIDPIRMDESPEVNRISEIQAGSRSYTISEPKIQRINSKGALRNQIRPHQKEALLFTRDFRSKARLYGHDWRRNRFRYQRNT